MSPLSGAERMEAMSKALFVEPFFPQETNASVVDFPRHYSVPAALAGFSFTSISRALCKKR